MQEQRCSYEFGSKEQFGRYLLRIIDRFAISRARRHLAASIAPPAGLRLNPEMMIGCDGWATAMASLGGRVVREVHLNGLRGLWDGFEGRCPTIRPSRRTATAVQESDPSGISSRQCERAHRGGLVGRRRVSRRRPASIEADANRQRSYPGS